MRHQVTQGSQWLESEGHDLVYRSGQFPSIMCHIVKSSRYQLAVGIDTYLAIRYDVDIWSDDAICRDLSRFITILEFVVISRTCNVIK